MREILQQLATLAPGIAAGLKGDGNAMKAFMDGYQRTMAEMDDRNRSQQQTQMQGENRQLALDERQRGITRQTDADARAAEDRKRRMALENVQIAPMLAEAGSAADSPQGAEQSIDALFQMLAPTFGGAESLAPVRDQAIGMAGRTITGRQKAEVKRFVEDVVKSQHVAEHPDADPLLTSELIPPRIQALIGKSEAKLSEVQRYAELSVGRPAEKKTPKADFTLGDTRYSGDGQPIVTAPAKPTKTGDSTPDQVFVVRDGNVTPIPKGTARPGDVPYSARNQNDTRPVTAGDTADIANINEALQLAEGLNFKPSDTGILPALGSGMPDAVTNLTSFGVGAKQRQGMINLVKQIIGKGLEGGVLRKEDEAKYAKILPTISDHPDVVQSKIATLKSTLEQKRTVRLDAMRDAGYDVNKFDARAGGASGGTVEYVRGPDGKLVRK